MIPRAVTVIAFASLTCVHALAAQEVMDVVPTEFVRMLALTPFMTSPDIAVGRLPDRLADDLAAGPGMRIVGSLLSRRFNISALVMPGRPAEVQESLAARLVAKGWRKLPTLQPPGGFETEQRQRGGLMLCSTDDYSVQLMASRHRGDSAAVQLFLGRGDFATNCVDPEVTSARARLGEAPIPALRAPAGTEHRGGGYSGGSSEASARGRLRTDMEPPALLQHYAAQMIDAGWMPGVQTASAEAALQVFRKTDDSRGTWQGVLYVITLPNRERELHLDVRRQR